ncbi:polyamine-modulated factor 1 isoform X1 [Agelaius tricolor]|uniref:polyamine-modulated factor 1 isoform X1 n=1 Tax=Agelaius tricolor TaxID=9191 RepID=UPI0039F18C4A
MGGGSGGGARRAMAAAGGDGGAGGAEDGGADGGDGPEPTAAPGRAQVFSTVVDTFLEKLVAAGSYQRFVSCYRCFYKLQPQLTRSIYDQFISQLQTSIKEEIQEVKDEGNLEALFSLLDKIVEEAKDREEPAWYGGPGVGVLLPQGHRALPGLCLGVLLASCCKEGSERCCVFTAVSLGLKHTEITLICASLGPGSISTHFLSAGRSVPLSWGDNPEG